MRILRAAIVLFVVVVCSAAQRADALRVIRGRGRSAIGFIKSPMSAILYRVWETIKRFLPRSLLVVYGTGFRAARNQD